MLQLISIRLAAWSYVVISICPSFFWPITVAPPHPPPFTPKRQMTPSPLSTNQTTKKSPPTESSPTFPRFPDFVGLSLGVLQWPIYMMKSFAKKCPDIIINPCHDTAKGIFIDTAERWQSCSDAYEYTWTTDRDNHLKHLNSTDKLRLIKSAGFCPHRRCQLRNASTTDISGLCPEGLCYTKLENGSPSFGACCFRNGTFNSGELIGYYTKCQMSPKPIYKRNRVIIGDDIGGKDESFDSFYNANEVYPGIIAAQCPLSGRPAGFANTIGDTKRLIIEQNISLWVQLAPHVPNVHLNSTISQLYETSILQGNCGVFPIEFFHNDTSLPSYRAGISDFKFSGLDPLNTVLSTIPYVNMSYIITGYFQKADNPEKHTMVSFSPLTCINDDTKHDTCSSVQRRSIRVTHLWYPRWEDFSVPPDNDSQNALMGLVQVTSEALRRGQRVVVSCLSGRGRTGTFAAAVAAQAKNISSASELVDIIVQMRESRDGLVETPAQFVLLTRLVASPLNSLVAEALPRTSSTADDSNASYLSPHQVTFLFIAIFIIGCFAAITKQPTHSMGRFVSDT